MKTITVATGNENKLREWLLTRGGIAVWVNKDLGSANIGCESYTPANDEEGIPMGSPHWSCGNVPEFVIQDPANVMIEERREVARVKVRNGPPYLGGINRADKGRLDAALDKHGETARYSRDYSNMAYGSAWFEAVITVADSVRPINMTEGGAA